MVIVSTVEEEPMLAVVVSVDSMVEVPLMVVYVVKVSVKVEEAEVITEVSVIAIVGPSRNPSVGDSAAKAREAQRRRRFWNFMSGNVLMRLL